jgi:hypothetical protein
MIGQRVLSLALGKTEIDSFAVKFIFFIDVFDESLQVFHRFLVFFSDDVFFFNLNHTESIIT